ncbi:MAG: hypothetical protein PHY30_03480 [Candidatus Pacebacteria bacterium]|nr:hypothetical protein [Candidatus Paceibacterota bacterium]
MFNSKNHLFLFISIVVSVGLALFIFNLLISICSNEAENGKLEPFQEEGANYQEKTEIFSKSEMSEELVYSDIINLDYNIYNPDYPDFRFYVLDANEFYRQQIVWGDLNGDGRQDAIVVLGFYFGGNSTEIYLGAVINENGKPHFIDSIALGDRTQINDIDIQGGALYIDMFVKKPSDPGAAPSQRKVVKYFFNDNKLKIDDRKEKEVVFINNIYSNNYDYSKSSGFWDKKLILLENGEGRVLVESLVDSYDLELKGYPFVVSFIPEDNELYFQSFVDGTELYSKCMRINIDTMQLDKLDYYCTVFGYNHATKLSPDGRRMGYLTEDSLYFIDITNNKRSNDLVNAEENEALYFYEAEYFKWLNNEILQYPVYVKGDNGYEFKEVRMVLVDN